MSKRPPGSAPGRRGPETQLFSLRLERRLWAELGVLAKLRGRSMNEMLGGVLEEWWRTQPERASVARLVKASGAPSREREDEGRE